MSEEKKEISVNDFMGAVAASSSITVDEKEEDVVIPVEELDEEDQKEIAKELKKEESQIDIGDVEVRSVLGVIPLEPVIVMVSLDEEQYIGDMKSIGVPGFINPTTGGFFLLDGQVPNSDSLREKVSEYINNRG